MDETRKRSESDEFIKILSDIKHVNFSTLEKYEHDILQPLNYFRQKPIALCKMLIPTFNYWLKIPQDKFKKIEEIMLLVFENSYM
jgi:hypothetical protein